MTCDLTNPIFTDETAATAHMESDRWPNGVNCPFCGSVNVHRMGGKTQAGMFLCNDCRDKFTVRTGTIFERSHIPLHKWLLATHLLAASKKGMSSLQLSRMLGITYKSAWFMCHRIRAAMRPVSAPVMGGNGGTVEMDATFVGGKNKNKHRSKRANAYGGKGKEPVLALVERDGSVTAHHVASVTAKNVGKVLDAQLHDDATFYTDDDGVFQAKSIKPRHRPDGVVRHSIGEYVKGDVHTNTIEGYFSILKRGIMGTYHHVSEQHLKRYLAEFDFRYNERQALGVTDGERAARALKGAVGKRLTYRNPDEIKGDPR
ncbi:MAG TPA: IS1595 family transposase [Xanthobacteraceae bacterium]|jgi:transposase-like protein